MSMQVGWYGVRLIFEALHPAGTDGERLFEERIILVRAASREEAREKGQQFGVAGQTEYTNAYGDKVRWVLQHIIDVATILDETVGDGSEVYSAFLKEQTVRYLYEAFQLDSSTENADTP